jgi:hypothetical protein
MPIQKKKVMEMASYAGGQSVKGGYYLSLSSWKLEHVTQGGGDLPGSKEERYSRVPYPAVMVAGPLSGLAYITLLPVMFCAALGFCFLRQNGRKLHNAKKWLPR